MTQQTRDLMSVETEPTAKPRHDAFDGKRKRAFLDALSRGGCLRDAARKAGVSHQTVYNHQAKDPQFMRQCELALDMAGTDVELHAWERGVTGVEEPVYHRGEIVGTRLKRSDRVLLRLLQATKPKKYGPNPGFTRKRLYKIERKRIEEEVRAELSVKKVVTAQETDQALCKQLEALSRKLSLEEKRKGATRPNDGESTSPGSVRAEVPAALAWPDNRAEQKPDSV